MMVAALALGTLSAAAQQLASTGPSLLRGSYPAFEAPIYEPPPSVCDATQPPCRAAGDGKTLDTQALQACIDSCPRSPGGLFSVVLRHGKRFLTGSLNLTTGCHLRVDGTLLGSTDPADYPVVPPLPGYGPGQRDSAVHGWGRHQVCSPALFCMRLDLQLACCWLTACVALKSVPY